MSYLDKIRACNQFDYKKHIPFYIDGQVHGLTPRKHAEILSGFSHVFVEAGTGFGLHPSLLDCESRTEAVASVVKQLFDDSIIDSWVGEQYGISHVFGGKPELLIERSAVAFIGVPAYGIHMNGVVKGKQAGQALIWVGKRTMSKPFWPGKLDQMVVGGQPAGINVFDNLLKEAEEEASIPYRLASNAKSRGALSYCNSSHRGLHHGKIFVFDLILDSSFIPKNTDGEVDSFHLITIEELANLTEHSNKFKDNCSLVNIDLLLRFGFIKATHVLYESIRKELYHATVQPLNNLS